jgi:hypothetical protein
MTPLIFPIDVISARSSRASLSSGWGRFAGRCLGTRGSALFPTAPKRENKQRPRPAGPRVLYSSHYAAVPHQTSSQSTLTARRPAGQCGPGASLPPAIQAGVAGRGQRPAQRQCVVVPHDESAADRLAHVCTCRNLLRQASGRGQDPAAGCPADLTSDCRNLSRLADNAGHWRPTAANQMG